MSICFYRDWLARDKMEFRILALLADQGTFQGNYTDICRYFSVSPQSKNRAQYKNAIAALEGAGYISVRQSGRTLTLRAAPREEKSAIEIPQEWYDKIRLREWAADVSWEAVLKVLLWAQNNSLEDIITNKDIADDTGLSESVICGAKKVLDDTFGAIYREKETVKVFDTFRCVGQRLSGSAFWANE